VRIVNPTYGVSAVGGEAKVGAPIDWMTDPIALFSNSKPNARELMDGLKAKLSDVRSIDNIEFIYKPSASQPAPAETMDEVVQRYRAALMQRRGRAISSCYAVGLTVCQSWCQRSLG